MFYEMLTGRVGLPGADRVRAPRGGAVRRSPSPSSASIRRSRPWRGFVDARAAEGPRRALRVGARDGARAGRGGAVTWPVARRARRSRSVACPDVPSVFGPPADPARTSPSPRNAGEPARERPTGHQRRRRTSGRCCFDHPAPTPARKPGGTLSSPRRPGDRRAARQRGDRGAQGLGRRDAPVQGLTLGAARRSAQWAGRVGNVVALLVAAGSRRRIPPRLGRRANVESLDLRYRLDLELGIDP